MLITCNINHFSYKETSSKLKIFWYIRILNCFILKVPLNVWYQRARKSYPSSSTQARSFIRFAWCGNDWNSRYDWRFNLEELLNKEDVVWHYFVRISHDATEAVLTTISEQKIDLMIIDYETMKSNKKITDIAYMWCFGNYSS